MSELNAQIGQLDAAFKAIVQRWQSTTPLWNDQVRREFEETYWRPLESQAAAVQREMERLAQVMTQARRNVK